MNRSIFCAAAIVVLVGGVFSATAQEADRGEQQRRFKQFLESRDTDGDGKLSKAEVTEGIDESRFLSFIEGWFKAADEDSDNYVTFAEADKFQAKTTKAMEEAELKFGELDVNADDKLSLAEATANKSGDQETHAKAIFGKFDVDSDGFVSKQELRIGVYRHLTGQLEI